MGSSFVNLTRQGTALIIIDVQEKLAPTMVPADLARCTKNCQILLNTAKVLGLSVMVTEQYAKGLGPTVPELREALPAGVTPVDKVAFSCAEVTSIVDRLRDARTRHVVLAGMETHICVLQSALGLVAQGFDVWVAQDACVSRTEENWRAGLRLCEQVGARVAPTETIMFLLLGRAGTSEFKALSPLIR